MLLSQGPDPSRIETIQPDQDVQVCGWNMVERRWTPFVWFHLSPCSLSFGHGLSLSLSFSCFEHGFISSFFFCIAHVSFARILSEERSQHMWSFIWWMDEWDNTSFQCRSLVCGSRVYVILIMKV
jgi:hypothetical protein